MNETTRMCEQICSRLADVDSQLRIMGCDSSKEPIQVYKQILGRICDFFSKYADKQIVSRLISSRSVTNTCRNIHQQIDTLLKRYDFTSNLPIHDWENSWMDHRRVLQECTLQLSRRNDLLVDELQGPEAQAEALTLLMFEMDQSDSRCSGDELNLIYELFQCVARLSSLAIPPVPTWFLPPHQVEFDSQPFSRGSYGSVHHGTWNDTPVVIN